MLSAYSASIIVCFLLIPRGAYTSIWEYWPVNLCLLGLALVVLASLAVNPRSGFRLSPQDLLMALLVVVVPNLDIDRYFNFSISVLLLQVSCFSSVYERGHNMCYAYCIGTMTLERKDDDDRYTNRHAGAHNTSHGYHRRR